MTTNDDWMNPRTSVSWSMGDVGKERRENPWIIQRCRRVPVTGTVASIEEWSFWSSFPTRADRDAALRRLRSEQGWKLRPASYSMGGRTLHIDEDEDDILAKAAAIKARRAVQ